MKTFVLRDSREDPVEINEENFKKHTKEKYPFVQDTQEGRRYYAVCPQCENVIQIRGLFHDDRKYGAHAGKSIEGFRPYNLQDYDYCPYSCKGKRLPKERRKPLENLNGKDRHVYQTVRDYYDLAVRFAKLKFGFAISNEMARRILEEYILSEGYLYPQNSVSNIPYMLVYLCKGFDPYGMWIRRDSRLARAIGKCPDLRLGETPSPDYGQLLGNPPGKFISLTMMVHGHTCREKDSRLSEQVRITISKDVHTDGEYPEWEDLVTVPVPVQEDGFTHFIHSPKTLEHRDQELLDMAHRLMPDII
jgi:hypothetical protein